MNIMHILLVFLGGGTGALCRYLTTAFISLKLGTAFPYGTLFVNTFGSFLIGFITFYFTFVHHSAVPEPFRLLTVIGFLGGFTTFSSFSLDTILLFQDHTPISAVTNILCNTLFSIGSAFLGVCAAKGFI